MTTWRAIVMIAVAAVLLGCVPVSVGGRNLDFSSWRAVSVAGLTPIPGNEPTLRFESGRLQGQGGCHGYVTEDGVTVEDGRLTVPRFLVPASQCLTMVDGRFVEDPTVPVEGAFFGVLGSAEWIAFRGDQLVISGPNGEIVLVAAP